MRCIQLGSSVGCSRVPQVHFVRKHFVRKQTMCKSLYTYLTICFAFENEFLVSKETVVLRRWERSKQKFGFIKRVELIKVELPP